MSCDSKFEIALVDGETPDLVALKSKILAQLDRDGIHHDVYKDITELFATGHAYFRLHPLYLLQLMDALSEMFPSVSVDARALGEAFRETWVAEYREGKRTFTQGPWGYE